MKAKDEALINLVKVLADAGLSVVKMDTSPEGLNEFCAVKTGEDFRLFGSISLLITAEQGS
ncbi:MAG: hypothetical protein EWM51_03605 [Treponema sp.]|nr:MAG: hypothetical protein EWM51_03605 [Treponema sp.]